MASHLFEPIRGERAHHEIIAAYRVQRIDQFAASHTEARASKAVIAG